MTPEQEKEFDEAWKHPTWGKNHTDVRPSFYIPAGEEGEEDRWDPEAIKAHINHLLNSEREEIAKAIDGCIDPDEYNSGTNQAYCTAIEIARSRITTNKWV